MNYYGAKDLAQSFRTVRENTIKIAEEIPEEHYGFRASPETRSIGETLMHIVNIPKAAHEIHVVQKANTLVGFDFMGFIGPLIAEEKKPHSKAELIKLLTEGRDFTAGWLEKLSDDVLAQPVGMPPGLGNPPSKTRFEMLLSIKEHEMHHRAQLMVLERMVGVVPHLTRRMQEMMARRQAEAQPAGR